MRMSESTSKNNIMDESHTHNMEEEKPDTTYIMYDSNYIK